MQQWWDSPPAAKRPKVENSVTIDQAVLPHMEDAVVEETLIAQELVLVSNAEELVSVLNQMPGGLQLATESLETSGGVMHLVLPENFEGTLQLQ